MDFFAQQDQARRNTTLMVFLFVLAVVAIVLAVDLLAAAAWLAVSKDTMLSRRASLLGQVPAPVYWGGTLAALAVIVGGTLYRIMQLSKGGVAVARMVGARWLKRDSQDPLERRLLNIVEEMAIASGITVPAVFVMDGERGINAFAAGFSPNEAAVTVTRGALEHLDRDQLQGVIGHEFSHILNGDMRLNVRLIGVIAGIVLIGSIGKFLMNMGRGSGGGGRFVTNRRGDVRLFAAGLALWLLGAVGVFFGQLIKAAVSRQREYLADAASVQFTRNPEGIAGALYEIGQTSGVISNRYAEELSHMYFGASVARTIFGLFETHPPIEDRIRRVLGNRALLFLRSRARAAMSAGSEASGQGLGGAAGAPEAAAVAAVDAARPGPSAMDWGRRAGDETVTTTAAAVLASVGSPTTGHIDYARRMLDSLPEAMREAMGSADGARCALLGLLVAAGGETRDRQAAMIRETEGDAIAAQALALERALKPLGARARLPVLELAIPMLRELERPERDRLLQLLKDLIEADRRVTVSEFVLVTICRHQFGGRVRGARRARHRTVTSVSNEIAIIVSLLIHAGRTPPDSFGGAMRRLGLSGQALRQPAQLDVGLVEAALKELELLAPLAKPTVIKACLAVIMMDDKLSVAEAELMRAICAALDTPLPPILETLEPVAT
ncbi:MAG: hypothetical protein A3G25_17890 [Betaproteobacteria bacterium RIFCSPLOWO2_12_FULL_63_13]|nr:MAG: hypothetical protein A3G25_17890 [Betaproteobacteria bacterium RIFCSPLOWO2_12_FULL_63_13]